MKEFKLRDMVGRVYYETAETRKKAIDQATKRVKLYVYIVDDLKIVI
ncbi:MAG: hypothetical protein ACI9N9_000062 [Enterobacterales bacterium]|jgi:hypothetical protein